MEMQNRNLIELMKVVTKPVSTNRNISLPKFNPENSSADPAAWCSTVDMCFAERPQEGSALIIALSEALQGSASSWLSQVCYPGIMWTEFKDLFIARFGGLETSAATLINLQNSRPKDGECLSSYSSRLLASLCSKWKSASVEEIAVSVVLAHLSQFDMRLQRLSFTTDIKSRNQLQNELKAFNYARKRSAPHQDDRVEHNFKRFKSSSPIKCNSCGKLGHKSIDCPSINKGKSERASNSQVATKPTSQKSVVTCFKCGVVGHVASRCPSLASVNSKNNGNGNSNERRVDICTVAAPSGSLIHRGESFSFWFDSGAECSLVKESIATRIAGKRENNLIILKGIGNVSVNCTIQILSEITINSHTLEILFHVIADDYLKCDILIGREILGQGFDVNITSNNFSLSKSKLINACNKLESISKIHFNDIDTDVIGDDKEKLISILKEYTDSFIQGFPSTRVNTGELKIRLVDPNVTVQRRPYRLSAEERQVVRDRVDELLKANVIRPSCSPFASPILLVKKKDGSDCLCVDYRELNANTIDDKFPLPLIADQIARLAGAKFFTCLDMASGFHQIPVETDSIERTAFVTPDGQYEYLTMPFGLKNAPSVFQRAVIKALGELAYTYVIVYMDDIMIIASTIEEALDRLQKVVSILIKSGFSFNFSKCSFLKTQVQYLGYEISAGEVRPSSRKIEALTALPAPRTVTQLRQFIGLSSYFRKFIPKFSQVMKPLYRLTSGSKKKY
ncbi:GSCOCG00012753001-RA-CDS [Cotesia congregata]|nr:GSCOCG00012753001-RA-CDS [Cotesia congregata]